jgi:hypothetical protein
MWSYKSPVTKDRPLEDHINDLWEKIKPNKEYIRQLKANASIDVFLSYTSNSDHAGFEVPHTALKMFIELEIPFGISVIT